MAGLIKVFGWSLTGAILGGSSMYFGLVAYDRLFEGSMDNTVRGFQTGQEVLTGIGGAVGGFVLGAIFGVIRRRSGKDPLKHSGPGKHQGGVR